VKPKTSLTCSGVTQKETLDINRNAGELEKLISSYVLAKTKEEVAHSEKNKNHKKMLMKRVVQSRGLKEMSNRNSVFLIEDVMSKYMRHILINQNVRKQEGLLHPVFKESVALHT
jgi:hypothetical protein